MWPFRKREKLPDIGDLTQQCLDDLRAFRKPGEKFNYLGASIIVTSVTKHYVGYGVWRAVMETNYRDNEGRIRVLEFYAWDLPAMRAENQ